MPQPVKLSDALVLAARVAGEEQERSIASQVEYWAKLGRCVEKLFDGRQQAFLRRVTAPVDLGALLEVVDTPKGRQVFREYLESEPFPHYKAHPEHPGLLIRTEEDGRERVGRFVNRAFVEEPVEARDATTVK
jgi:hypothetical protein